MPVNTRPPGVPVRGRATEAYSRQYVEEIEGGAQSERNAVGMGMWGLAVGIW